MSSFTRVLLLRHGQSTWNALGRWQGQADPPLSALGQQQAKMAADCLGTVDVIMSSTLVRARQTAEILASSLGVGPVMTDPRFVETDAGDWTGHTREEIETKWPGWLDSGRRPDNYENDDDVVVRLRAGLADCARQYRGALVVIVAHGGVIRALNRSLGDRDESVPNLGGRQYALRENIIIGQDVVCMLDTSLSPATHQSQV
jgi:broad specificity phosphatase PhoE